MKTNDKKIMAVCTGVAVITGAAVMGGVTGTRSNEAMSEYINAKTDEERQVARKNHLFWGMMRIAADIAAACGGYAAGLLIKDAFDLGGKK